MASGYERILGAEVIVVMGVETADALFASSGKDKFKLPDPSVYFATLVAYMVLAGVAMFGEKAGRLAASLGGVVGLAILLTPTAASKQAGKPQPLAISLLDYFNSLIASGPSQAPVIQSAVQSAAQKEKAYQKIQKAVGGTQGNPSMSYYGTGNPGAPGLDVGSGTPSPAPPVYTP
jgi:hypothetical protein